MTAKIIDGKQIAAEMRAEIKAETAELKKRGIVPGLGVVLVGDDPASRSYVTAKERACEEAGIFSDDNRLPADTSEEDLLALVARMNNDPKIHGILVQLPLPKHIDEQKVLLAIDPDKDVDGFHPVNVGKMVIGEEAFLPCTPHGVVQMLARSGVETSGAHVVVVGRSNIVGKPVANMLLQKKPNGNATVTVCHTRTRDIGHHTRQADIVIVAAGRPNTITADMVKRGRGGHRRGRQPRRGRVTQERLPACRRRGLRGRQRKGVPDHAGARRRGADDDHDAALQHPEVGARQRLLSRHRGKSTPPASPRSCGRGAGGIFYGPVPSGSASSTKFPCGTPSTMSGRRLPLCGS